MATPISIHFLEDESTDVKNSHAFHGRDEVYVPFPSDYYESFYVGAFRVPCRAVEGEQHSHLDAGMEGRETTVVGQVQGQESSACSELYWALCLSSEQGHPTVNYS